MKASPLGTARGFLRKALNSRKEVVVISVDATAVVQEQMERIQAHPSAMIHLGQALMASLLLQALGDPSEEDKVQAEWLTDGPFGHLYAEAMGAGKVRGTIGNPLASPEAFGRDLGVGILQVRRHHSGIVSTGMVESTGRVATDLVEFLEKSDQRASGSNLSVKIEWLEGATPPFKVQGAHGFLVHVLPGPSEAQQNATLLRWDAVIRALGAMSKWAITPDNPEASTREILQMLCGEENPQLLYGHPVRLYCTCSEERATRAVTLLKSAESEVDAAAPAVPHSVRCEYCGSVYLIE